MLVASKPFSAKSPRATAMSCSRRSPALILVRLLAMGTIVPSYGVLQPTGGTGVAACLPTRLPAAWFTGDVR